MLLSCLLLFQAFFRWFPSLFIKVFASFSRRAPSSSWKEKNQVQIIVFQKKDVSKILSILNPQKICLWMFFKICVIKNFGNFTKKHLRWSLFFNKSRVQYREFSVKFSKFLTAPFYKTSPMAASEPKEPAVKPCWLWYRISINECLKNCAQNFC